MPLSLSRVAFTLLLFTALVVAPASGQDAGQIALITDLAGSVQVATSSSNSFATASWGTQLFEGHRIKTLDGAQASILFSNGNLLSLGSNSSMTISAGPGAASQARSVGSVSGELLADASDLTLYRAGAGEVGALSGLRSSGTREQIELFSPRNTRIMNGLPEFSWHTSGEFEVFIVKVLSENGVVWSDETSEQSVTYPADAPALVSGTQYFWQVEGEDMLNTVKSSLVSFEILSDEDRKTVEEGEKKIAAMFTEEPGAASHLYVLGSFYAREGLLSAAIESFSTIAEMHPDAARAHEILGKLYYDVDRKDDAVEALQNAVRLGQGK